MKTIYKLTMPGDCEGRSSTTVGHFADKDVAHAIGRTGYGNMLMGPHAGNVDPILVYEDANEFYMKNEDADPTKYEGPGDIDAVKVVRARALAKLSDEEKLALGLA